MNDKLNQTNRQNMFQPKVSQGKYMGTPGSGIPKAKLGEVALKRRESGLRGDILKEALDDLKQNDRRGGLGLGLGLGFNLGDNSNGFLSSRF